MKKIIILIPVYNDWESLRALIAETSSQIKNLKEYSFNYIIVNDGSTLARPNIKVPENIDGIKIINMKTNRGHTTCIAYGIHHVTQNEKFDKLILMDGDGEDRPEEIVMLINKNLEKSNHSVVAKRVKRSEGILFKILYQTHKLITIIFAGKKINFGNFSLLTREDLFLLSSKENLWSSYSGTFKKYVKNYEEINSIRGKRYFGPSKMSILKLLLHSFSIIAIFKYNVFLRSSFMIIILAYSSFYMIKLSIMVQISIIIFNLMIFVVSLKKNNLKINLDNFDKIENIFH